MGFKELFARNKLKPHLTYSQKGNINRLFLSGSNIVVCETRDMQVKEVYLFSLNYLTKEVYLRDYQLDEKWWISIENVNDDIIFLHTFKRPDMPEPLGIKAIDIKSGSLMWENKDLVFYFSTNDKVFAFKQLFEKRVFHRLNALTGEVEEEYRDSSFDLSLSLLKDEQERAQYRNYLNTDVFSLQSAVKDDEVNEYLSFRFNKIVTLGDVEFIRCGDILIYNFHISRGINLKNINETYYSNRLEIYDLNAKRITYQDTLNDKVLTYVPDSFFIKDDVLFYIREKKELMAINLK